MRIRPLNNYLILEMEDNESVCDNEEVNRIVKEGTIVLPDKNSLVKVSAWGRVVMAGLKCVYPFKKGERVFIEGNLYKSAPFWYEEDGKKYRIVSEDMLAVSEER